MRKLDLRLLEDVDDEPERTVRQVPIGGVGYPHDSTWLRV
jgi:hypothetical protein